VVLIYDGSCIMHGMFADDDDAYWIVSTASKYLLPFDYVLLLFSYYS
jgi:hypothetical protein